MIQIPMDYLTQSPKVLLIDDNETDNLITKRIIELSNLSKDIVIKNSGSAGLKYLNENESNSHALPDLIFLDINMPVIDGFMFLFEYEKMAPRLARAARIVILSSSDNQAEIERIIENEYVMKYVLKPINQAVLAAVANDYRRNLVKVA